jgi:hypothetical protein
MRIALDRLALLVDWFSMARVLGSHLVLAGLSAAGEAVRLFELGYDTGSTVLRSIACMELVTVDSL